MTIRETIDIIQGIYSKGIPSDDSRLTDRQIYNKLTRLRSTLLAQKSNKRQTIGQWNYQTIPCISLSKVPLINCPCVAPPGMFILKTINTIPSFVYDINGPMMQPITSIDGSNTYGLTKWETRKYQAYEKYTSKALNFFIRDGYIYLTSDKHPEKISLTAIFSDPIEAYQLRDLEDKTSSCIANQDRVFPIDRDIMDAIADMSKDELIKLVGQMKADTNNDSQDDTSITLQNEK